ncbi:MAG: elongation factor G [Alphaproteobacteria bacterium]|nr:elongation factor G [Alphaproteobacteria bacterium]
MTKTVSGPRCAAIVGPYLSGKTTLLEDILHMVGATDRRGTIKDGNTVGDSSTEARSRSMSTEINVTSINYLDEPWTIIDCPGSVEISQDGRNAIMVADIVVVVCEPTPDRAITVSPWLQVLDDHDIPHIIYINKMDTPAASVRSTFEALQTVSDRPLILREIPLREGDKVIGHVDLVSERAYGWNEDKPSTLMQLPDSASDEEQIARIEMLESLADFDDGLMEELLEDVVPSTDEIYENLTKDLQQDLIVPVFFGSAEHENGITRLLKALRHETAEVDKTADRLGIDTSSNETIAQVFKTLHAGHSGKLSLARVWSGELKDGDSLGENRVSGVAKMFGRQTNKLAKAVAGDIIALARMDEVQTSDLLSTSGSAEAPSWPSPLTPLFSFAIHVEKQADEVKLMGALHKLSEEDPSLSFIQNEDTGEFLLQGQGEIHLQIAAARLKNDYNLSIVTERPHAPYKETIRKGISQHARYKKQSGGHGEFGDVHIDIKPLPRGEGFSYSDTITGGVVPKQYIPAVEKGVIDYLKRGPLGFQVVDLSVVLTDGQYHAVDSSDMAFQRAGAAAMREGMPQCSPVLLEPILNVSISIPNEFTSKIQRLVSGRRGQILGFNAKEGCNGWDEVKAMMPQAETVDLIIELRSLTLGVGTYEYEFDHLQEFTGKQADQVVEARAKAQK